MSFSPSLWNQGVCTLKPSGISTDAGGSSCCCCCCWPPLLLTLLLLLLLSPYTHSSPSFTHTGCDLTHDLLLLQAVACALGSAAGVVRGGIGKRCGFELGSRCAGLHLLIAGLLLSPTQQQGVMWHTRLQARGGAQSASPPRPNNNNPHSPICGMLVQLPSPPNVHPW